ncbi:MAG: DUF2283 domain-containing protein [candidate division KSB1 bacterium]|nr:DUF2283 domain-containing protein [candidate division KSB1 bacterium]MDZ7312373.1 DUF2283 domain-containing protein [candidate division KSB1 bacterium]
MKVYYDDDVDAVYLKLSDETPNGVVEIVDGINLDTKYNRWQVGRHGNSQRFPVTCHAGGILRTQSFCNTSTVLDNKKDHYTMTW